jgi:hypothetical protein
MSGQLVGEVVGARRGCLAPLTQAETLALVAIASRCNTETRQGWVAKAEIQAAIGQSERTTERVLATLTKRGLIGVAKRGYNSHGVSRAPVYWLAVLPPPKMAETQACASATLDGGTTEDVLPPNPDVLPPNQACASATLDGDLNVLTDVHNKRPPPSLRSGGSPPERERQGLHPLPANEWIEPPVHCPRHPDDTTEPCIPCMIQRKEWEQWQDTYDERAKRFWREHPEQRADQIVDKWVDGHRRLGGARAKIVGVVTDALLRGLSDTDVYDLLIEWQDMPSPDTYRLKALFDSVFEDTS